MENTLNVIGISLVIIWTIAIGFIGYNVGGIILIFFLVISIIAILLIVIQLRNQFKSTKYKNQTI